MDHNLNLSEIKEFLCDISVYLRSELKSVEYQNTSHVQNGYNETKCKQLLNRCSYFLNQIETKIYDKNAENTNLETRNLTECSYLDMSAKSKVTPCEYVDFSGLLDNENDSSINVKLKDNDNNDNDDDDDDDNDDNDDKEIYEICNVSLQTIKSLDDEDIINCPYIGLPATHLSIQKSPKYGQLLRIEKRLFFGQTKKYFCGIIQDWLLCYGDGLTSIRPTFCMHLNCVEVEHYGEGKRRDLCFQITEYETNKKIIFQATSEIDTKEWIHAIEASIRGDFDTKIILSTDSPTKFNKSLNNGNNIRKLPTPPIDNKSYPSNQDTINNDDIYEEPCPLYINSYAQPSNLIITESDSLKPPDIPIKIGSKTSDNIKYDYDVPKATKSAINISNNPIEYCENDTKSILCRNRAEFQTKIKDVHSKLSNQLSGPSSSDRLKYLKKSPQQHTPSSDTKKNTKALLFKDKDKSNGGNLTTPIKNSFWNRLNKNSPQDLLKVKPGEKEKENLLSSEGINISANKISKGGKVNMIINQLEANGHLPIFTRNFERLSNAFTDSGEDCSYEPIMTSGSGKF